MKVARSSLTSKRGRRRRFFKLTHHPMPLLAAERVDGIETRGFPCGIEAEDDDDQTAESERQDERAVSDFTSKNALN